MNPQKYTKAGASAVGAALGVIIGFYMEWPPELVGAAGVVLAGLLTVISPANKA